MKWFKNAYDRADAAEYALAAGMQKGLAHEYYPGFRQTRWCAPVLGSLAIMNHYPRRMVFNPQEGCDEPVDMPFYRVQLTYSSQAGEPVSTLIEFDHDFAYLKRSSEYANQHLTKPEATVIWDEAMAALDETLLTHATKLGWAAVPPVVELVPYEQFVFLQAA